MGKRTHEPGEDESAKRPRGSTEPGPEVELWIDRMFRALKLPERRRDTAPIRAPAVEPSSITTVDENPPYDFGFVPSTDRKGARQRPGAQRRSARTATRQTESLDALLRQKDEILERVKAAYPRAPYIAEDFESMIAELEALHDSEAMASETTDRRIRDLVKTIDRLLHGEIYVDQSDPEAVKASMKAVGYAWHEAATASASPVGLDLTLDPGSGVVTGIAIADRPKAKHPNGSNGQHTTAFAAYREAVAAAVLGQQPDAAAANLRDLVGRLLHLPCFTAPDELLPVPDGLKERIEALRDASSTESAALGLAELAKEYLELRDAIPGASLHTAGEHARTTGSGERFHLDRLRTAEPALLGKLARGEQAHVFQGDAETHMAALSGLFDESALELMPNREQLHQVISFLMTAGQAFPAVFNMPVKELFSDAMLKPVGRQLCEHHLEGFRAEFPEYFDAVYDRIAAATALPPVAPVTPLRPRPGDFTIETAMADGRLALRIKGRPASMKDGGAQGDHTSSEVLMKGAAVGALLPGGVFPMTSAAFVGQIDGVLVEYDPARYEGLFPKRGSAANAPYRARLEAMREPHGMLLALRNEIAARDPDAAIAEADVARAAKLFLELVDQRPTAVNYDAPARGRGEAKGLRAVAAFEADPPVPRDLRGELATDEARVMKALFADADGVWRNLARLIDGDAIQASLSRFGSTLLPLRLEVVLPEGAVAARATVTSTDGAPLAGDLPLVVSNGLGRLDWDGTIGRSGTVATHFSGSVTVEIAVAVSGSDAISTLQRGPIPIGEAQTAFMATVVDEFVFFLAKAFPNTYAHMIGTLGTAGVRKAVAYMVNEISSSDL